MVLQLRKKMAANKQMQEHLYGIKGIHFGSYLFEERQ